MPLMIVNPYDWTAYPLRLYEMSDQTLSHCDKYWGTLRSVRLLNTPVLICINTAHLYKYEWKYGGKSQF